MTLISLMSFDMLALAVLAAALALEARAARRPAQRALRQARTPAP
ncbi:hypothetical protein [Pontitalea aquivivens]